MNNEITTTLFVHSMQPHVPRLHNSNTTDLVQCCGKSSHVHISYSGMPNSFVVYLVKSWLWKQYAILYLLAASHLCTLWFNVSANIWLIIVLPLFYFVNGVYRIYIVVPLLCSGCCSLGPRALNRAHMHASHCWLCGVDLWLHTINLTHEV